MNAMTKIVPVHVTAASLPFIRASKLSSDMTTRQVAVLALIAGNPGASVSEIAETAFVSKPVVTRACDKLVELGLVQRLVNKVDNRRVALFLTAHGKAALSVVTGGK